MELPSLQITFDFEPGERFDANERYDFWDSPTTFQWFKARGYSLYQCIRDGECRSYARPAVISDRPFIEAQYPYAHFDTEYEKCPGLETEPLRASDEERGKVIFAQDRLDRHVAIKLVRAETDEYRILRFLSQQNLDILKENCIIPVLELLPIKGFWFAVMPR